MDRIRIAFVLTFVLLVAGVRASTAAPTAYVVNLADGVSVIDTGTNTVLTTVSAGVGPQGVAITPDGRFAYVPNVTSSDVSVIDTSTNAVVTTIGVGEGPFAVTVAPNGTFAYVAVFGHLCLGGGVWVIDTLTNIVAATVPLAGCTTGLAVTPDGAFVYAASNTASIVSVIETRSNIVASTIPVGSNPHSVAITPNGAFAYVTHSALSGASANSVSVIETATNTVATSVAVGAVPQAVAVTPNGAFAYVANFASNDVSVIDTSTNTVVATVAVGTGPSGVAITPDGTLAYVTNSNSDSVSVIATATRTVVATVSLPAGVGPRGVAVANTDTTAPETSISSGPADGSFINSIQATFAFTGSDDRTTPSLLHFTCSLDNAPFASCASPQVYTDLAERQHTFAVKAIDEAGNVDPTPATRTWTVDVTPPVLFLSVTPNVLWPPNHQLVEVTVTVSASDPAGVASVILSKVECNEPDQGACPADAIQGAETGTLDTEILLRSERSGGSQRIYTLTYQATDLAGNTGTGSVTVIVPAKSP